ncbi:MAG: hypothetical protein WHT27_04350 [candidate division WOR-3 bacterium]
MKKGMIERLKSVQVVLIFLMLTFIFRKFGLLKIFFFSLTVVSLLFLIFLPKKLFIAKKLLDKLFLFVAFLFTVLIVVIIYYIIFLMFKPILYIMDKRFYKNIKKQESSYYNKYVEDEFDIEEPF